jgi:hypothetical protein
MQKTLAVIPPVGQVFDSLILNFDFLIKMDL